MFQKEFLGNYLEAKKVSVLRTSQGGNVFLLVAIENETIFSGKYTNIT